MVFNGLLDLVFGVLLIFKTPCFGVAFSTFGFFVFMWFSRCMMWGGVGGSMMHWGMVNRSMMKRGMVPMMGRSMVDSVVGRSVEDSVMGGSMVDNMVGRSMVGRSKVDVWVGGTSMDRVVDWVDRMDRLVDNNWGSHFNFDFERCFTPGINVL